MFLMGTTKCFKQIEVFLVHSTLVLQLQVYLWGKF